MRLEKGEENPMDTREKEFASDDNLMKRHFGDCKDGPGVIVFLTLASFSVSPDQTIAAFGRGSPVEDV